MTRMYDDALRPVGLRITQFSVLASLANDGEARVRDLSAELGMEETTLTRSVATLEKHGWVSVRVGEDQRERYLYITGAGLKLLAKATPLWRAAQQRVQERISRTTWQGLFRALPLVVDAASPASSV